MSDQNKDMKRDAARRRIFMKNVPNYASLYGLEIGALCSPMLTPDETHVKYYDIFPTEELIAHFQKYYPGKRFVDVDYVARTRSLSDVLGGRVFNYVIANRVIEHIPDFIGFFKAIHETLSDNGILFLAFPDKRAMPDSNRSETTAGHVITDYENGGSIDAAEHILDSLIYQKNPKCVTWQDIERQRYCFANHHHVFNAENCIEKLFKPLIRMRYLPFSVIDYTYEPDLDNEFVVVLEKCTNLAEAHILNEKVDVQPLREEMDVNGHDFRVQLAEIHQSGWFDSIWYLTTYPDVRASGINPLKHYYFWGAAHGYNPSERFDSEYYLKANPEVAQEGLNPLWHYIHIGVNEGRLPRPQEN